MPDEDYRSELLSYATRVAGADDEAAVYEAMAETAAEVLAFDTSVVEVERDGFLAVRAWAGRPPPVDGIPVEEGIAGTVYRSGDPEVVADVREDPRVDAPPDGETRSALTVPLGDVGVFQAGVAEPDGFDETDLELAELLAAHATQAVQRIRSQRELAESEARFRGLFEHATAAIVLYDATAARPGRIEHANPAARRLFEDHGPTDESADGGLVGETLADLLVDVDPNRLAPAGDGAVSFEAVPVTDPDRVLDVTIDRFGGADGPNAFAVLRDVTEAREHEATLTRLHEATREMMSAKTPEDVAEVAADTAEQLLGLPYVGVFFAADDANELRPVAIPERFADSVDALREGESLAWQVFERGDPQLFEDLSEHEPLQNPDTDVVQEYIHPIGDHGVLLVGSLEPGYIGGRERDLLRVLVTNMEAALDRSERESELRDREAELREERNRIAALFENIPSPTASFVIQDGDPVVESVNPAFERVFGYDPDELVGENIDEYIVPPGRETEATVYNEKLQAGESLKVDVSRQTADGPRDFLLDVVPFRLNEPNVHGYAMYTDITERKERERELERQNDRLEEFASIVSHDLRNPLNVARGYLELAEETGDADHFERADDALERMHDIIESVLTLARQGRSLDETEPVSLREAAEDAWRNVETSDASLAVAGDPTVHAAPSRLGSLLENLMRNAVEHAGEDAAVRVGALTDDHGFYVEDDGPGVPEDRRDEVFESGETSRDDGTGFGLAIVQSIADAHGWGVHVAESEHLAGSPGARFEFHTA